MPAPVNFAQVKQFLTGLPDNWDKYGSATRNRLLKLIIEKVELTGNKDLEATIYWKTGFKQTVRIHRSREPGTYRERWTEQEIDTLRELYPSAPDAAVRAALPGRSWKSISKLACRLNLKRTSNRKSMGERRAWTIEDDKKLAEQYQAVVPVEHIAKDLNRTAASIMARASTKKLSRPDKARWPPNETTWSADNPMSLQVSSSGKGSGDRALVMN